MKVISFFNEKGGVGKTIHSALFASYLAYGCKKRVCVLDFEANPRVAAWRNREIERLGNSGSALLRYFAKKELKRNFYDIVSVRERFNDIVRYNVNNVGVWLKGFLLDEASAKYDYVILDFPSGFELDSVTYHLLVNGYCDCIVVPVDTDPQTLLSASLVAKTLLDNEQSVFLFWNNVSPSDIARPGMLDGLEVSFCRMGLSFFQQRIKSFQKARRDADGKLFVRSTVCWPERYVEMSCPELPALYRSIFEMMESE